MKEEMLAPALDTVNKTVTVEMLRKKSTDPVTRGEDVFDASTPKAAEVFKSPMDGFVVYRVREGQEVPIGSVIAVIYDTAEEAHKDPGPPAASPPAAEVNATAKARALAEKMGIDLRKLKKDGTIREKDVLDFAEKKGD